MRGLFAVIEYGDGGCESKAKKLPAEVPFWKGRSAGTKTPGGVLLRARIELGVLHGESWHRARRPGGGESGAHGRLTRRPLGFLAMEGGM